MIKNQVSIILPTFNRAYCLDRTIQSVLNQTFINWELVIIDNHSTDFTEHLVSSYNDKRISFFKKKLILIKAIMLIGIYLLI